MTVCGCGCECAREVSGGRDGESDGDGRTHRGAVSLYDGGACHAPADGAAPLAR